MCWLCLGCVLAVSWLCLVVSFKVSSGERTNLNWGRAGFIHMVNMLPRLEFVKRQTNIFRGVHMAKTFRGIGGEPRWDAGAANPQVTGGQVRPAELPLPSSDGARVRGASGKHQRL